MINNKLRCLKCGVEIKAGCNCGVAYEPAGAVATKAVDRKSHFREQLTPPYGGIEACTAPGREGECSMVKNVRLMLLSGTWVDGIGSFLQTRCPKCSTMVKSASPNQWEIISGACPELSVARLRQLDHVHLVTGRAMTSSLN
jgi:hypothetical protein